jgi:soluble lytic murein transglycosylase
MTRNQLHRLILLPAFLVIMGARPTSSPPVARITGLAAETHLQAELEYKQSILNHITQIAPWLNPQYRQRLASIVHKESREQGVDPRLIIALIATESSFRSRAKSRVGARGLMQIRLLAAQEIAREMRLPWRGADSLYDPAINVRMGTYYLAKMQRRFGDLGLALTAYNIGPTALRRLMVAKADIPTGYSQRVLKNYGRL